MKNVNGILELEKQQIREIFSNEEYFFKLHYVKYRRKMEERITKVLKKSNVILTKIKVK